MRLINCVEIDFNQPAVDNLPPCLKELTFGSSFNQEINNLPSSLSKLELGDDFRAKRSNINSNFITKLKKLYVERKRVLFYLLFIYFCRVNPPKPKPLPLPTNLTHLTFGGSFNEFIPSYPLNVSHIAFVHSFNQSISNLPSLL